MVPNTTLKYELPIVRIDLGRGDYVIAYKHLKVKTQREILRICGDYGDGAKSNEALAEALAPHSYLIFTVIFANQVVELSLTTERCGVGRIKGRWGRTKHTPPFVIEELDTVFQNMDADKFKVLDDELGALYKPDPLEPTPDAV